MKTLLLILFSAVNLLGQIKNPVSKYNFNLKIHKGFVLNHGTEVEHLANQRPTILEADIYKSLYGTRAWHQVHHFPEAGMSFNYVLMEKHRPLGNMGSVVFYMSKKILESNRHHLSVRIGMGPGYVAKIFDLYTNYKNIMFGSHFNFCLNGRLNYRIRIGRQFNVNTGIGIIHFSNGALKFPNQGINIPSIHLGLGFQQEKVSPIVRDSLPPFQRKLGVHFFYGGGIKEEYPIGGPKFWASTLSAYLHWRVNRKSGLILGLDFFHDPSLKRYYGDPALPIAKQLKAAVLLGHELFFGKLSFLLQGGFYIYDKNKIYIPVYQRYGLKYALSNRFFLQFTMKAHFGSVDYVETGIGYKIH